MKVNEGALLKRFVTSSYDVEHIIQAGFSGSEKLHNILATNANANAQEAAAAAGEDGSFGYWFHVANVFVGEGYPGLLELAMEAGKPSQYATYIIGFIEDNPCLDTERFLVDLIRALPEGTLPFRIATAINLVCSFRKSEEPVVHGAIFCRFLNSALERAITSGVKTSSSELAIYVYALRSVGNAKSIELIDQLDILDSPFRGASKLVRKTILRRLNA